MLTERAWQTIRRGYDSEPGQRHRTPSYPGPRLRAVTRLPSGQVLAPPPSPTGGGGPTTRLWSWQLREAGVAQRGTVVSPAFTGPALIADLAIQFNPGGDATTAENMEITISPAPGIQGNNQAAGATPPGVSIFDTTFINDGGFAQPPQPGLFWGSQGGTGWGRLRINRLVTDQRFFINVSRIMRAAGANVTNGVITIIENVDPANPNPFA